MSERPAENQRKRVQEIALQAWLEGAAQDPSRRQDVLQRHANLADELNEEFRRLRMIDVARRVPAEASDTVNTTDDASESRLGDTLTVDGGDQGAFRCRLCGGALASETWGESDQGPMGICTTCADPHRSPESIDRHRPGDLLGNYQLTRTLGSGSFGSVWLAYDLKLQRQVALKIPRRGMLNEEEETSFIREARVAASVSHPRVVAVHDVGMIEGVTFICTEYIAGSTLGEWAPEADRRAVLVSRMIREICDPLQAIHDAGIVHRDLKPSNVLLDEQQLPKVTDFGVAKSFHQNQMTVTGQVLGTPSYMAPEVASGSSKDSDARTDIFSLGVILYELLAGQLPFQGDLGSLLRQICHVDPPALSSIDVPWEVPEGLARICMKCLEKDRRDRYATARELADDLRRFEAGEPVEARPKSWGTSIRRRIERHPVLSLVLMLVAIVVPMWGYRLLASDQDLPAGPSTVIVREPPTDLMKLQAEIQSQFEISKSAGEADPYEGMSLAVLATHKMLGVENELTPEYVNEKRREVTQWLIDSANNLATKRLLYRSGQLQSLQWVDQDRLLARRMTERDDLPSKRGDRGNWRGALATLWSRDVDGRLSNRTDEWSFEVSPSGTGFLVNSTALLSYPESPSSTTVVNSGEENESVGNYRLFDLTSPRRAASWTWKDTPAQLCHLSDDGRSVWTVHAQGEVHCVTAGREYGLLKSRPVHFSPHFNSEIEGIEWSSTRQVLVTQTPDQIQFWNVDLSTDPPVASSLGERIGRGVATNSTGDRYAVYDPTSEMLEIIGVDGDSQTLNVEGRLPCDEAEEVVFAEGGSGVYVRCGLQSDECWRLWDVGANSSLNLISWPASGTGFKLVPHPQGWGAVLVGEAILAWNQQQESLVQIHKLDDEANAYGPVAWIGEKGQLLFAVNRNLYLAPTGVGRNEVLVQTPAKSMRPIDIHESPIEFLAVEEGKPGYAVGDSSGTVHYGEITTPTILNHMYIGARSFEELGPLLEQDRSEDQDALALVWSEGQTDILKRSRLRPVVPLWETFKTLPHSRHIDLGSRLMASLSEEGVCRVSSVISSRSDDSLVVDVSTEHQFVALSQDERWVLVWGKAGFDCFDLSAREPIASRVSYGGAVVAAGFAHDPFQVVLVNPAGELASYDLKRRKVVRKSAVSLSKPLEEVRLVSIPGFTFALDRNSISWLAGSEMSKVPGVSLPDSAADSLKLDSGINFSNLDGDLVLVSSPNASFIMVLISRKGHFEVLKCSKDRWDRYRLRADTNEDLRVVEDATTSGAGIFAVSPDGESLFYGVEDQLLMWTMEGPVSFSDPVEPTKLPHTRRDPVTAAIFTADSNVLVLGFQSGRIEHWERAETGGYERLVSMPVSDTAILGLEFREQSRTVLFQTREGMGETFIDLEDLMKQLAHLAGIELPSVDELSP